ncbi:MAG: hypothetical protein ACLUOJ_08105 [Streptococcus salivarius]
MVSTATKVGQFTFANCLMNAAGVHCMTKEELAEVEASAAGSFVTKTGTLEKLALVILNLDMLMFLWALSTLWVCLITVLNTTLTMSLNYKSNPIQKIIFFH